MRRGPVLALLLLIMLPLALLGGLGIRLARDEERVLELTLRHQIEGRLGDLADRISRRTASTRANLIDALLEIDHDPESMRRFVRREPRVRQVFLLDSAGTPLYPAPAAPLSVSEREFLDRAQPMWKGPVEKSSTRRALHGPPLDSGMKDPMGPQSQGSSDRAPQGQSTVGWIVWTRDSRIHILVLEALEGGGFIGAEIENMRMLADIIADLPDTATARSYSVSPYLLSLKTAATVPSDASERFALTDSTGRILYQFGTFDPREPRNPLVARSLDYPLDSWRLRYDVPDSAPGARNLNRVHLPLLLGLASVGLGLMALGGFVFREYRRDAIEAAQRVTFVNQVSHELKTPLTNIRMYTELLTERIGENLLEVDPKARHHLDVIADESQRLSRLITNVLTFSRRHRDENSHRSQSGIIDETIESTIEIFRPSMQKRGIEPRFEGTCRNPLPYDPDALSQILGNLLGNVEKYATGTREVRIRSRVVEDQVIVDVEDDGPGIALHQREAVFEPFKRLSERLEDGAAGTGIGLTIARDLARRHGGDLVMIAGDSTAHFQLTLNIATTRTEAQS